jgi:hypothetical protein
MIVRALAGVVVLAAAPQEPVDTEKLFAELQEAWSRHKSVSANLAFEAVDSKGARSPRYKGSFHFRPAEGWLHFNLVKHGETAVRNFILDVQSVLAWEQGGKATRMDVRSLYKAMWGQQYEFGRRRRKLRGEPEPYKDLDDFTAHLKPLMFIQLDPGGTDGAMSRIALGMSEKGGASWLRSMLREWKVEASAEEVTISEKETARTTVIDRRTGFLRSIRVEIPESQGRVVTVTDFAPDGPKPEIRLPEKVTDRPARVADAYSFLAPDLASQARGDVLGCLEKWSVVGREDHAKDLGDYLSWIAAEYAALELERAHVFWASAFVKNAVDGGTSLDELAEEAADQADDLESYLHSGEGAYAKEMSESLSKFRFALEKAVSAGSGPDEAKPELIERLREAFQPDRVRAVRTLRARAEPERLLREAIDAAREKPEK